MYKGMIVAYSDVLPQYAWSAWRKSRKMLFKVSIRRIKISRPLKVKQVIIF
jgi:hypothetical protein